MCWNALRFKWIRPPKDGSAAYQVVAGVMYLLAYDGYGFESKSPEMDSET